MEQTSVYVGMALTDAPIEFREGMRTELLDRLRAVQHVEVLDFLGLEAGTDLDVYAYDRSRVEAADIAAFICDHPSTGLGMEIVFRFQTGKPMVLFSREGMKVTRMLTGFAKTESIRHMTYRSADDIYDCIMAETIDISAAVIEAESRKQRGLS